MSTQDITTSPDIDRWIRLKEKIAFDGNPEIAAKLDDIITRLNSNNHGVYVAFCGLFSAGKSSLLNALCRTDALATGAVPTTSSVAEVILPGSHDAVHLLDTPGIDSTDAQHHAEMRSVLHRADVIALVMDYQHVESDANLEMARGFTEQGKRTVLVVNQIDKHVEWELSFEEYQERIERTMAEWDIVYDALYFTSSDESPYNELNQLRDYLLRLGDMAPTTSTTGMVTAARELVTEHVKTKLMAQKNEVEQTLVDSCGVIPLTGEEATSWLEGRMNERDRVRRKHGQQRKSLQDAFQDLRVGVTRSIDLAQIAPYDTTERGRTFVESLYPSFKVGWIASKTKTEQERAHRLETFVSDLRERTEKFLVWPLQASLREWAKNSPFAKDHFVGTVERLNVPVDKELCEGCVKRGALGSSDSYPYQYVKDVVQTIKGRVSATTTKLLDEWEQEALRSLAILSADEEDRLARLTLEIAAIQKWLWVHEQEATDVAMFMKLLSDVHHEEETYS